MNGGDGEEVDSAALDPSLPLEWKFSGERTAGEDVQEVDIISAVEFDKTRDLATGGRSGRVVLFERTDVKEHGGNRSDLDMMDYPISHTEFRYKTEFQSHEPEVQEKKIKKISDMNVDPSKPAGNCTVASSSGSSNPKLHLADGGSPVDFTTTQAMSCPFHLGARW